MSKKKDEASTKICLNGYNQIFIPTGKAKYNVWHPNWKLRAPGNGHIYFSGKANKDLVVAVSRHQGLSPNMYEITIGGWDNSRSSIRKGNLGKEICFKEGAKIPNKGWNDYKIIFNSDKKTIAVLANGKLLLSCWDKHYNNDAEYFSFSRWKPESNSLYANFQGDCRQLNYDCSYSNSFRPSYTPPRAYAELHDWDPMWQLVKNGYGQIHFEAKGHDLLIAVSTKNGAASNPMYEIVLGGWGNSRSVVRNKHLSGKEICAFEDVKIPQPENFNNYQILFDSETKTIDVMINSIRVMNCHDPNYNNNVRYFTFGKWDTPVEYKNLCAGDIDEQELLVTIRGNIQNSVTGKPLGEGEIKQHASIVFTNKRTFQTYSVFIDKNVYEVTLPKGIYLRKTEMKDYVEDNKSVELWKNSIENDGLNDLNLTPVSDGWTFVVQWGKLPSKLSAYLLLPNNRKVWYNNKKSKNGHAKLHYESMNGYGPATITLDNKAPKGSYTFYVVRHSTETHFAASNAHVKVYHNAELIKTVRINAKEHKGNFWHVLRLDTNTEKLHVINKTSNREPK